DRSFVADLLSDRSVEAIVRAIINLGHAMGLRVVAEGVEDRATLERLGEFGCDQAQGFLLAHPLELGALMDWIRTWENRANRRAAGGARASSPIKLV
ncbi:MAG: EAL domain-containing protein, partial [Gammaproteobacteria bacterium]|nr:EAL domain-containing protein [Gammaproteobacteria bacterium]